MSWFACPLVWVIDHHLTNIVVIMVMIMMMMAMIIIMDAVVADVKGDYDDYCDDHVALL